MLSSHPKHPPQEAGFGQVCKPGAVEVETGITEFAVHQPSSKLSERLEKEGKE